MNVKDEAGFGDGLTGVLLVNLGTPDSPAIPDVRKYLRQFLLDERVIDIPELQRQLLVNLIIAPFRAPKSAKAYSQLWNPIKGSPLKYYGYEVERLLQEKLGSSFVVKLAMRYQSPSLEDVLDYLKSLPLRRLVVLPLFPQYASASNGSVVEAVSSILSKWQTIPDTKYINRFFDHPGFIEAFASIAKPYLQDKSYDKILFSYHGLPERQIRKGDTQGVCAFGDCCNTYNESNQWCYRAQCFATTRLLVKALGLKEGSYLTAFQSRLGKTPWIKPYTDDMIHELRKLGVESVAVLSPSFVADCLETTVEIGDEYKKLFESLGGKRWQLIPSLNDTPKWIDALASLVQPQSATA